MRQAGAAHIFRRRISPSPQFLLAGLVLLALTTPAVSDPYRPRSSAGLASVEAVHAAVGVPRVEVACPDQRVESPADSLSQGGPHMTRGAKVTLEKAGDGYRDTAVMDTLLFAGLQAALQQCPMQTSNMVGDRYAQDEVGYVDIFGKLTEDGPEMRLVHADHFLAVMGQWARVIDEGAAQEQQVAAAATAREREAEAEASARQQAEAQAAQAKALAAQQAANAQAEANAQAASQRTGSLIWLWIRLIFFGAIGLWIYSNRFPILGFWYGLTPHPASGEVTAVLEWGRPYNPERFAELLAVTPANSIEREVRVRQAAELLRNLDRHAEATKAEIEDETEYRKSQLALLDGMEMHALIKHRLSVILRAQGKLA